MSAKEIELEYADPDVREGSQLGSESADAWLERQDLREWLELGLDERESPSVLVAAGYVPALQAKLMRRRARMRRRRGESALRQTFEILRDEWITETLVESSLSQLVTHRAYQRIIGLGRPALPLILEELERRPAPWFWALTAITGEDPAAGETSLGGATAKWLAWADEQGLRQLTQQQ